MGPGSRSYRPGGPAQCSALADDQTGCESLEGCTWSGSSCQGGVGTTHCEVDPGDPDGFTCFYPAGDANELSTAFEDIAGRVASCSHTIDGSPPDLNRIFVYFNNSDGSGLSWVERDQSRQNGWDLDATVSPPKVNFYGAACDHLKDEQADPLVVYGCPLGG